MRPLLGIFDSGLGGLSVLKKIQERHTKFKAIYLADSARIPYGSKDPSEIRNIAFEIVQWFNCQEVSALVVACNTTNSLAIDVLKRFSKVPVFDLIGSFSEIINESKIGVLATPLTVSSKAYTSHIKFYNPLSLVLEEECPEFVPIIENGDTGSKELLEAVETHLAPLLKAEVQAIVLGCSHYPIIMPIIKKLVPSSIRLIDPAVFLSKRLDTFLSYPDQSNESTKPFADIRFCVTSDPSSFSLKADNILGVKPEVEVISLCPTSCVS